VLFKTLLMSLSRSLSVAAFPIKADSKATAENGEVNRVAFTVAFTVLLFIQHIAQA
jgi:hypothetical protein